MADSILPTLVGKLVPYIAVSVVRQFSYLFHYDGNLEEFRRNLRELEMAGRDVKVLVEADERNGKVILPSVEDWLKRVDAVSDESQRFVGEEDAISKCCFNGPLNLKVRYQRSRKAKKKAAEFDRIKKDGRFDSVSLPAPPLQVGFMNTENEFDFESRRSVFNEIMDAIKDDGVEMIGIWGIAGIGKTTLVKRVAKYAKDEGLFDVVAMAVVSQNPSVKAIQGQIADMIGLKFTNESEGGRAGQLLQSLLTRKKILVILDDIWDSRLVLNDIGIPSGSQHKGCKVILTSRIRGVCEEMRTGKNFKIDLLSASEALGLFLQMSGINNRFSVKGRLAENLSEECGRLPISIVIVARGLLDKEQFYWTDMLNRLRNSDPDSKVHATIKLSYNNLYREEEKTFFLLCALFPEDYEIPVRVLFEYGIGLDLFEKVDNADEALVRAHKLASSLKSSSLLLDEGSEKFVKMHDVVRDVALAITSEGKNAFLVRSVTQWREWQEKTAISLWFDDVKELPDALDCPQLQILMLNCRYPNLHLRDNFFTGMKNLIVLDMSGMEFVRLPQSSAALENLRTLRLSDCKLGDISTIGKLQNLVSLSFYDSNIEVLPKEVGELSNLTLLDLSSCERLKVITPGVIQNLSQLEVLYTGRNVLWCDAEEDSTPKNASLSELIHLSRLMILEICISNASMLPDEVLFGNLTKFKVSIGDDDLERKNIFCSSSQILMLKCISQNELTKAGIKMLIKKAQHLELEDVSGISIALPFHLGGFSTLKELIVSRCKDVNYILDMNKSEYEPETPSLQQLHLIDLPLLKEITVGKFPSMFVSELEHFRLIELPSLVRLWPYQAELVALANLTTMKVETCNELKYVFEQSTAKSLLKLKELVVRCCRNLQAIYLTKEEEQDNVIIFPQLSHLKLSELDNLTSFGSKFSLESTLFGTLVMFLVLETLDLYKLERLKKIWHIHSPVESFFQLKVLKLTHIPKLLVVFPPQATSALRNLEEICIENCYSLETLFQLDDVPLAVGDEMVLFPRLLTLKLVDLRKLTAILSTTSHNISQATVNFPILKSIHLEGLRSVKKIWHNNVSTKCFSQLQQLHVSECDQLVEVFPCHLVPNLHCLEQVTVKQCKLIEKLFQLDSCHVSESNTMTILKQLKILNVNNLPKLRNIWWTNDERLCGVQVIFSAMEIMSLLTLHNLESIVDQQLLTFFPKLKKLHLVGIGRLSLAADQIHIFKGLEALEELIIKYNTGKTLPKVIATLPKLRKLQFGFIQEQIEWSESLYRGKGFQSLTSLNFCYCSGLKSLLTPSAVSCLVQLQELLVNECEIMESIVGETSGEQNFDKVIEFSKLHTLRLGNLPHLTSFYNGNCALNFPCLGDISIERCSQLKTFTSMTRETPGPSHQNIESEALFGQQVSFGRLSHLKLWQVELIEGIWHRDHPPTTVVELSLLKVEHSPRLLKIFPTNLLAGLQDLERLYVKSCVSLEHVFAVKDHPPFLSNLQQLELYDLPKLKQLWWNENTCESFGLPSLRSFSMDTCPGLQYVFDASVANHLENLTSLFVVNCSSIVEIVEEKPGRKIMFPLLNILHLVNLPCFKGLNQNVEFPQAEYVLVDRCLNMKNPHLYNVKHRRNKNQLPGSTRFFESFVE